MVPLLREFHRAGGVKIQQGRQRRRAEKDLDRINRINGMPKEGRSRRGSVSKTKGQARHRDGGQAHTNSEVPKVRPSAALSSTVLWVCDRAFG